jgi:hypothetical protein
MNFGFRKTNVSIKIELKLMPLSNVIILKLNYI